MAQVVKHSFSGRTENSPRDSNRAIWPHSCTAAADGNVRNG